MSCLQHTGYQGRTKDGHRIPYWDMSSTIGPFVGFMSLGFSTDVDGRSTTPQSRGMVTTVRRMWLLFTHQDKNNPRSARPSYPKAPCSFTVCTYIPKLLHDNPFTAQIHSIQLHGVCLQVSNNRCSPAGGDTNRVARPIASAPYRRAFPFKARHAALAQTTLVFGHSTALSASVDRRASLREFWSHPSKGPLIPYI